MVKQTASIILQALLLVSILAFPFNIRPIEAEGTIYIRADGSVYPPSAPISTVDRITYTFTGNISDSIVVERNNILMDGAGYTVQGDGIGRGVDLSGRTNVTLTNMKIETFDYGIYLSGSNYSAVSGTEIASSNIAGINLYCSFNNRISGNNITANVYEGVYLYSSSNNTISGNNITANGWDGVYLYSSSNNTISGNNIKDNGYGVSSYYSSNDRSFHNNFINNTSQVDTQATTDVWDDGYPSGGNYWSNYTGMDEKSGPNQDLPGSDGIGDTPYGIDENNQDRYPLMKTHDIGIQNVTTSKTVVGQGYKVGINAKILNYGINSETFNVTVYVNTTSIATQTVTLRSISSTTITFTWNTTGFVKGNYTIKAIADTVLGEIHTTDNTHIDSIVCVSTPGDINGDTYINIKDAVLLGVAFSANHITDPSDPRYCQYWRGSEGPFNPNTDINSDGFINIKDAVALGTHFGLPNP